MKPAAFVYSRPDSVEQALLRLADPAAGAKLIAGGQSLAPMMNMRLAAPAELVDLNDLTELAYVRDAGEALEIGALTRHDDVAGAPLVREHCPLLAQAAATIGHYAIRQRDTLGGSLAHADPAAQLPLVAVTLPAQIEVLSNRGARCIPASEFFLSAMTTALLPDELIQSVRFPKVGVGEGSSFHLFNRRQGDFAIVAVAACVAVHGGRVARLRLGLGGVDAVPADHADTIRSFVGEPAGSSWVAAAAQAVADAANPQDDPRVPAAYRRDLVRVLTQRALLDALQRARERAP